MKKQIFGLVLTFSVLKSLGQSPPNLLCKSEEEIKYQAGILKARLTDHNTTRKGKLLLHFNLDYNTRTGVNNIGNTLYYMLFRFDLPDSCTLCVFGFGGRKDLDRIVSSLDKNRKLRRQATGLSWYGVDNKFDVDIFEPRNSNGFSVTYTWLNGVKTTEPSHSIN